VKMGLGGPGYRRSRKLANMSRKLELSESGLEWRNIDLSHTLFKGLVDLLKSNPFCQELGKERKVKNRPEVRWGVSVGLSKVA